jgi:hypothetical protein
MFHISRVTYILKVILSKSYEYVQKIIFFLIEIYHTQFLNLTYSFTSWQHKVILRV